jgi:predicted nucleotidyltransferase
MSDKENLIKRIKDTIHKTDPKASLILFGSYARGDFHEQSDLDLLVLIDKEEINREDQKRIKYPLYDIEFETGMIISPIVFSKKDWENKHRKTPFYENVSKEGLVL